MSLVKAYILKAYGVALFKKKNNKRLIELLRSYSF
jgi:hypothetical protein